MEAIIRPLHLIRREDHFHQVYKRDGVGNIACTISKVITIKLFFLGINIFLKVITGRITTIKVLGIINVKYIRTGMIETIDSEPAHETVTRRHGYSKIFLSIPLFSSASIDVFEELKQDCKTGHIPP